MSQVQGKANAIVHWLNRSYSVRSEWSRLAIKTYIECEGNAELARTKVAEQVHSYFLESKPDNEIVKRWTEGLSEIVDVMISAPEIDPTFTNWAQVADYLLLPCASTLDEVDEANTEREEKNRKQLKEYNRQLVILGCFGALQKDSNISDSKLLDMFSDNKATLPMVKEARKLLRIGNQPQLPEKPVELKMIELYQPIVY